MRVERADALDASADVSARRRGRVSLGEQPRSARVRCTPRETAAWRMASDRSRERLARRRQEDAPSARLPVDVKRGAEPLAKIR